VVVAFGAWSRSLRRLATMPSARSHNPCGIWSALAAPAARGCGWWRCRRRGNRGQAWGNCGQPRATPQSSAR